MSAQTWGSVISAEVGQRVAEVRRRRGLSAQALSDLLSEHGHELSRSSLTQLELGKRGVTLADFLALATALDVSPIALMVDAETRQTSVPFVPGLEVNAGTFFHWWSGAAPATSSDEGFRNWKHQMEPFTAWREYEDAVQDLAIRAYLMKTLDPLDTDGSQTLVDETTSQYRKVQELASRVPWADLDRDLTGVYRAQSIARRLHLAGVGWLEQTRDRPDGSEPQEA